MARICSFPTRSGSNGNVPTQVAVLQRALEALKRAAGGPRSADVASSIASVPCPGTESRPPIRSVDEYKYVGFEDQFRGDDAAVEERVRVYLPIFEARSDVLD